MIPWSRRPERACAAFVDACRRRDDLALRRMLHRDAVATLDSGGGVALPAHARGREAVAQLIRELLGAFPAAEPTMREVNADPGVALADAGRIVAVIAVARRGGRVGSLWIVVNPDKLRRWNTK